VSFSAGGLNVPAIFNFNRSLKVDKEIGNTLILKSNISDSDIHFLFKNDTFTVEILTSCGENKTLLNTKTNLNQNKTI